MKISRFGNNNSELLDALIANANKETVANEESFMKMASKIITQKKSTSLREILSQSLEGFGDDMAGDDMAGEADLGAPEMGEAGVGEELPLDGGGDLPTETPGENDEVKQKIVDALVALCGGPEEAKACLDQYSGAMPGAEGGLDTPMDDPMADPMGEGDPMGEPVGAELGGEAEMPAPMEMSAPASPMAMPY